MASPLRYLDLQQSRSELPNRLNELWRNGRPHIYATSVAEALSSRASQGSISSDAPSHCIKAISDAPSPRGIMSAGSHALVELHHAQFEAAPCGIHLNIAEQIEQAINIRYQSDSLLCPYSYIELQEGARAHIIEEHVSLGDALIFSLRRIKLAQGASLRLELREIGSGKSHAFNISEISVTSANFRQISSHSNHAWAREESICNISNAPESEIESSAMLLSANRLEGKQILDQRSDQNQLSPNTSSRVFYKNVIDDKARAIFDGNIYVAKDAHYSDAQQTNRNMMLSETASIYSLPGLEILADKVQCSHGSASGPMDAEELFYLCSRGISRYDAQKLVAEGFLQESYDRFSRES